MELEFKEQITAKMKEWIDKDNPQRTQAALAAKAKVSETETSLIARGIYVNGKHKGVDYPIKAASFLKMAIALGVAVTEEEIHWNTHNFTRIQQVCQAFRERKKVGMFDSDESGVGKTYSLEYFKTFNDQVAYVKVTGTMGKKELLLEVATQIIGESILNKPMGVRSLLEAIRSRVQTTFGYIIIFDELEYAKTTNLHLIKEIIDFTYGYCAVVACGMGLSDKITKLADKKKFGFPQLKRRLATNVIHLRPLQNTEKVEILKLHAIVNPSAVKWFNKNVHDFQMMSEYVKDIVRFMKSKPEVDITEHVLDQLFKAF